MQLADIPVVARIHERTGFDYRLPAIWANPRFPIKQVGVADGRPVIASVAKVQAEIYLWLDPDWGTPQERWDALKELHAEVVAQAEEIGFDQIYCVLPPEIAESFGPRLKELGWCETRPWPHYTLELSEGSREPLHHAHPERLVESAVVAAPVNAVPLPNGSAVRTSMAVIESHSTDYIP